MGSQPCKAFRGARPARAAGIVLAVALAAASAAGGCSLPVVSLQAEAPDPIGEEPAATGSLLPPKTVSLAPELAPEDWRRARAALAVALDPQGNGKPVKWDNPESELKGTINPVGSPFVRNDEVCRIFLATITGPRVNRFVRGTGCRPSGGAWELKSVTASAPAPSSGRRG